MKPIEVACSFCGGSGKRVSHLSSIGARNAVIEDHLKFVDPSDWEYLETVLTAKREEKPSDIRANFWLEVLRPIRAIKEGTKP